MERKMKNIDKYLYYLNIQIYFIHNVVWYDSIKREKMSRFSNYKELIFTNQKVVYANSENYMGL